MPCFVACRLRLSRGRYVDDYCRLNKEKGHADAAGAGAGAGAGFVRAAAGADAAVAGCATLADPNGRRMAQKASTASSTDALISPWRSGVAIASSSPRLMIEPASSSTAGIS